MGVLRILNSLLSKGGEKIPKSLSIYSFFPVDYFFFFFGDRAKGLDKNKTALR